MAIVNLNSKIKLLNSGFPLCSESVFNKTGFCGNSIKFFPVKMRNKALFLFFLLILLNRDGFSQFDVKFKGGTVIPLGYFENSVDVGFGGTLNLSTYLTPLLEVSFTTGYYYCGFKEDLPDYDFSFKTVPVLAGMRYNFSDFDFITYIGLEGGVYFSEFFLELDDAATGKFRALTPETNIGISPEIGFKMNIAPGFDVDVNAKYNRVRSKYVSRAYLMIQSGFVIKL